MLHVFLWAIFAVWGALGIVIGVGILVMVGVSTTRMIADRRGRAGTIWCPIFRRQYDVVGTPPSFAGRPFDDLKRCERYGSNRVLCRKNCLRVQELVAAAGTN